MDNQLNIFDFLEPVEEHESDYCEGCIFYREKCMYTKESKTDFCIEGKKKLKINDHIFSVSGNKITNLTITDHKGSSPNYFDCIDRKGQKVHVNILTIREWWDVSLELAKKCKFFEETTRKTKTLGEELREQGWINIHDREPSTPGMYEMYVVQLNRKVKNEYKGDHIWKALKCGYEASWWRELPVCKYSNHTCNKEVLHALAKESNPFCPGVCCRFCNTKYCGVRCNGSEEPKEPKKAAEHVEQKQDIVLLPDFAKGKGWISVDTIPQNMKWHIDVLGTYKYENREYWSKCKGYYSAKDNKYHALDYPIDIPKAEWKFWRYRNSCVNCQRYVKSPEQPPEGWGEAGWCNEHKQKVSSAEIGYCQKHERLDFYEY